MIKDNNKKVAVILSYIIILLTMISGFLTTPLIIKKLGAAEYGLYQLVSSIVGYLIVLDFGLGASITRYIAKYRATNSKEEEEKFIYMGILIYMLIAVITLIISIFFTINIDLIFSNTLTLYELQKGKILLMGLSISFSISLFSNVFTGIILAYERFNYNNITKILKVIIRIIALFTLLNIIENSIIIVFIDLILTIVFLVINIVYVRKILKIKIKKSKIDFLIFKDTLTFSIFMFLQIIINQINININKFLLGIMTSTIVVGVYAVAMQIYIIYCNLSTAIGDIYLPSITKLVTKKASRDELLNYIIKPSRIQLIILTMIFSGFLMLGREFIVFWVGESYMDVWLICIIIMIPSTIELSQNIILSILKAEKKLAFRTSINLFIAILNLGLSIILIKYYGAIGAAIGTFISIFLGYVLISNWYYHRFLGLNMKKFFSGVYKGILKSTLITIVISFSFIFIKSSNIFIFLGKGICFISIYCVVFYFLGANSYEKNLINGFLKRLKLIKK